MIEGISYSEMELNTWVDVQKGKVISLQNIGQGHKKTQ